MVDQLVNVFKFLDTAVPEQVIDVPKISLDRIAVLAAAQPAEQLVEVPTVVSLSFFSQLAEQNVDIPVPGARGSLVYGPEQSPTAQFVEQNVNIPVSSARGRCHGGGLRDFPSGRSSTARGGADARGARLQGSVPEQSPAARVAVYSFPAS